MKTKTYPWSNFIYYADKDLESFCVLNSAGLIVKACFSGVQTVEKYFKALYWSQNPEKSYAEIKKFNHKILDLAEQVLLGCLYNQKITETEMNSGWKNQNDLLRQCISITSKEKLIKLIQA